MKKKSIIFIGIALLALVLTTGTFAFTYTNSWATLGTSLAAGNFATYEVSAGQPDWASILPEGESGSDILIPEAAGDKTELTSQYPSSGSHWDKVDEQPADDGSTYVSTEGSNAWLSDLYNLSNITGLTGDVIITNVTVYFRFASSGSYNIKAMAALKTNGTVKEGVTITYGSTSFTTRSWECAVNPITEQPWTLAEINDLQAGVTVKGTSNTKFVIVTQVYVVVSYEFANTQGNIPIGNVYKINPAAGYTGDLLVKIYLTNTADLLKAYEFLNIKVFVGSSIEAGETPNYKVLGFETGAITFSIEGGSANYYVVQIAGGSYRFISNDPADWGAGYALTPEFFCEVAQR
jgi:hypothetical protein